ncbi:aminotransferase, DegT/DnrJ/EryC1/StrS family [Campylobacter lanienae NCTC 13004]|uniref:Aminotransferase, DegT/DnrJ/EryC1/StrS family n=1 Tax=Campylobacter lanienae NCTC 13004 TaxID=1031753 RepID=A0A1X9SNE8_9BACT|nr:LegC family aminotransferase [Campylobacter lanienae]ARQ97774.1 aminotransferase, DegT/DnrJ/EryC1/StrS family [Campylobacter lanienae NCTC 13004]
MEKCNQKIVEFIQNEYKTQNIALHEPRFIGNEIEYLKQCIDSGFVSSVGEFVVGVERDMARITGAKYAVAMCSGTAALHIALICAGVGADDEVITQPLSFVATANAISYTGARAIFVDVDMDTMGMSPYSLSKFLDKNCIKKDGKCYNKISKKFISACVPMHTFGMMCKIDEIAQICDIWGINLVEDSAESLGSVYKGTHSGRFGLAGVFSFNGNKIATSGGGGMLISDDENVAKLARHLSTTAKIPHPYEYNHDYIAYNYRMPNLNAALLKAQLENLNLFLSKKRDLAKRYAKFFDSIGVKFISEPVDCLSNYWLMGVIMDDRKSRDELLKYANERSVMMRPAWRLLSELEIYKDSIKDENKNAKYLVDRIVNIPSSVVI